MINSTIVNPTFVSVVSSESAKYLLSSRMKKTLKGVFPILFNFRRKKSLDSVTLEDIAYVSSKENDATFFLNKVLKDAETAGIQSIKIPKKAEIKLKGTFEYV